jgi:FkbM family methyltransferase
VMDCGALYGDHTIAYAKAVGKDGAVFAIEANKLAFECLSKNAERFEAPIFCMNLALCEHHLGTAIHVMDEHNIGASQVKNGDTKPDSIENEIRTASIDGIASDASLEQLNFIKMDCEGWEYKILQGARNSIKKFKPILLIEMNSWTLSLQGSSYKEIYDFLIEMNYSWRIVQPEAKGGDQQYDVLAWPNQIEKLKLVKGFKK